MEYVSSLLAFIDLNGTAKPEHLSPMFILPGFLNPFDVLIQIQCSAILIQL